MVSDFKGFMSGREIDFFNHRSKYGYERKL